jgi:hypothetical protein
MISRMALCASVVAAAASCVPGMGPPVDAKVGLNFARTRTVVDDTETVSDSRFGVTLGAEVEYPMGEALGFRTGVGYAMKGGQDGSDTNDLSFLEVPALVDLKLAGEKAFVLAGLNAGILLGAVDDSGESFADDLSWFNVELVLGGGARLKDGKLGVGLRYELGLVDLSEVANTEYRTSNLQFVVTYGF